MHGGFLYQHLYAANCLLRAGAAGTLRVAVERDEDIEMVHANRRVYVQVKKRKDEVSIADITGALERFAQIREEHGSGS